METYEKKNNILFDVCMKTRFDINYPEKFYPFVHTPNTDIIDKITLNNENKMFFQRYFTNINDHIHFLKQQKIKLPDCWSSHRKYNFGGYYLNNYISLENITNGSDEILYMYNDYVIFGKRQNFIKLKDFFDEYGIIDHSLNINHSFAAESQLLIFCFEKQINPIMYLHHDNILII